MRAASVYKLPDLSVVGEEGLISLIVRDKRNDSSNIFSVDVGTTEDSFCYNFKVENINKILVGNYNVVVGMTSLSDTPLAKFVGQNKNSVNYWIALEKDSSFG